MIDFLNSLAQVMFDFWVITLNYDTTNEYLMGRLYEQCLGCAYMLPMILIGIVVLLVYVIYLVIRKVTWKQRMLKKWRDK